MGGIGSGTWLRTDAKVTTASVVSIDIRAWQRDGSLKPGTRFDCSWSLDGQFLPRIVVVHIDSCAVTLQYAYRRPNGFVLKCKYPIDIQRTRCHFGGERPWFLCPRCGRRAARLFGVEEIFTCRRCQNLAYPSQRMSAEDRALRRAQAIRVRLGGTANVLGPFPDKPKWMRWRTYGRNMHEAQTAAARSLRRVAVVLNQGSNGSC